MKKKLVSILISSLVMVFTVAMFTTTVDAVDLIDHHLMHNYSNAGSEHAEEMNYSMFAINYNTDNRDPASTMGAICSASGKEAPFRIFKRLSDSHVCIQYNWSFEDASDNLRNTFAYDILGLTRNNDTKYEITQADLDAIFHYAATSADTSAVTLSSVVENYELLISYLHTISSISQTGYTGTTVRANFQSRKAVDDMVKAQTQNFNWPRYDAILYNTMGDNWTTESQNYNWGGMGSYTDWKTGQKDLVVQVSDYARNTTLTGKSEPVMMLANIFQVKRDWSYDYVMKWYADNSMRFDHYFNEQGGADQRANGVVPSTSEPAYVDPDNPTTSYIPCDLVSVDNVNGGVGTFTEHLTACGDAGLYGAWFGWYGQDIPTDYTNAMQLTRAIPNWDNIAGVAVPDYDHYNNSSAGDERTWDGSSYWSTNSGASQDVVYSRNPENGEFYIVFNSLSGVAYLPAGASVEEGYFVDSDFAKTTEDALPALNINGNEISLKSEYSNKLDTGIRLTILFPPVNLTATAVSSSQIDLSWDASTDNVGVTGYRIYRDGVYIDSVPDTTTTYSDTGLSASTTYEYKVSAYDAAANESEQSTPASATTEGQTYTILKTTQAPTIDGDITEFEDANVIQLTNAAGTTGTYKLMWDDTNIYVAASVTDTKLNAAATQRDGYLWDDDSIELMFDTLNNGGTQRLDDDYKFFVNVLEVQHDSKGTDSTWNIAYNSPVTESGTVNDNGDTDTGYTIEISIPWSSEWKTAPTAGDKMGFELVLNDRDETGTATQTPWWNSTGGDLNDPDGWGEIEFSSDTISPPASEAPTVPENVTAVAASMTQVNLRWDASTDDKGLAGYKIYRNGNYLATVSGTAHTDTSVSASTTYEYKVLAYDGDGNESAQSTGASVTTPNVGTVDHHFMHNFSNNGTQHAEEMNYSKIAISYNQDTRDTESTMGAICNATGKEAPFVLYKDNDDYVCIKYNWSYEDEDPNFPLRNTFAYYILGITRNNGAKTRITQEDLDAIFQYAATNADTSAVTLQQVYRNYELLISYLHTIWDMGDSLPVGFKAGTTVRANLQSKKVVDDIVKAQTLNFNWDRYDAFFFDCMGDVWTPDAGTYYNYNWGGMGSYTDWKTGQKDMVVQVSDYARDTELTGKSEPVMMLANIYQIKRGYAYDSVMKWYADNSMRFDHYFNEQGGDAAPDQNQRATGVVPSTSEPAYVDPSNPTTAYIPCDLVSVDNVYTGVGTFTDHLKACGDAGLYGAWFGWYGEDRPTQFTNVMQLTRAIPNWDNIACVEVPDRDSDHYQNASVGDERTWDGSTYWSINSGASQDVVYSRNPINGEFYIVFNSLNGVAYLPAGASVVEGYFVDGDFAKTTENAIPALDINGNEISLKSGYSGKLGTGIRLTLTSIMDHHFMHNFSNTGCDHAEEMNYSKSAISYNVDNRDPKSTMGAICNATGKEAPFVIYKRNDDVVCIKYNWSYEDASVPLRNTFAYDILGITRYNGEKTPITQEDLDAIFQYAATTDDTSTVTLQQVYSNYEGLISHLNTIWEMQSVPPGFKAGTTVRANLQSKKVVDDMVKAQTQNFNWDRYDAFFFDCMGDIWDTESFNYNWGGMGSYTDWKTGQKDLVVQVSDYARDTELTGKSEPVMMLANIYQIKRGYAYDSVMEWYADNSMRFDHYFNEQGGDAAPDQNQRATGVVPSTSEPAYVDPSNPTTAYIPCDLVSVDNPYTGVGTFTDHLKACGDAGLYGAWFGWYGEDKPEQFTNAMQLTRAIPNWDNLAGVAVPGRDYDHYQNASVDDKRTWDGSSYWSTNSCASQDVVYSTNPINGEFYIVFKTLSGVAYLPTGASVVDGKFVDGNFAETSEDALSALDINGNEISLKSGYSDKLETGIRLRLSY